MKNSTRFRSISILVIAIVSFMTSSIHAQEASLDGNVLTIPVLQVGDQFYSLQLTLALGTDPLVLTLSSAEELSNASAEGASTFANNTLTVPALSYEGVSYNLQLALTGENPVRFGVLSAGVNESAPSASTQGSIRTNNVGGSDILSGTDLDRFLTFNPDLSLCDGADSFFWVNAGGTYDSVRDRYLGAWINCDNSGLIRRIGDYGPDGTTFTGISIEYVDFVVPVDPAARSGIRRLSNWEDGMEHGVNVFFNWTEDNLRYVEQISFFVEGAGFVGVDEIYDSTGAVIRTKDYGGGSNTNSGAWTDLIDNSNTPSSGGSGSSPDDDCAQLGYIGTAGGWVSRCNIEV